MDILSGKKSKHERKTLFETEDVGTPSDNPMLLKTRKTGVWSEEESKSAKSKSVSNMIELERFHKDEKEDGTDDIPIIPDIDDLQEDSFNLTDVKKIISVDDSTYKELDSQFDKLKSEHLPFGTLGDIDMSFLIGKMYPESDVKLCQEEWTLDSLYKDISKELLKSST